MSLKISRGVHVEDIDFDWLVQNGRHAAFVELGVDGDKAILLVTVNGPFPPNKADKPRSIPLQTMPSGSATVTGAEANSPTKIVLWKDDNGDAVPTASPNGLAGFAVTLRVGDGPEEEFDVNVPLSCLWNGAMASEEDAFEPVLLLLRDAERDQEPAYVGPDIPLVPKYVELLEKLPDPKERPTYRGPITARKISYNISLRGRPVCRKEYSHQTLKPIGKEGAAEPGFDFYLWPNRMDSNWKFYSLRFGIPKVEAWLDCAWQVLALPAGNLPDQRTPGSLFADLVRPRTGLFGKGKGDDDTVVHRKTIEHGIPDFFVVQASAEFAGARGIWRISPTIDNRSGNNDTAQFCFDFGTSNSCLAVGSTTGDRVASVDIALPVGANVPERGGVLAPLAAGGPKEMGTVPRHHDGLPWVIGFDRDPDPGLDNVAIPTTEIPSAIVLIKDGPIRHGDRLVPFETVAPKDTAIQVTAVGRLRDNLKWSNDPFDGELVTQYVAAILLRALSSPACSTKSATISFTYPLSMPESAKSSREAQLKKALAAVHMWTGVTLTPTFESLLKVNESVAAAEAGGTWARNCAVPTRLIIDIGGGSVDLAVAVSTGPNNSEEVTILAADSIHFGANLLLRKLADPRLGLVEVQPGGDRIAELKFQIRRRGLAGILSTKNMAQWVLNDLELLIRTYFSTVAEYGARMLAATMMADGLADVLPPDVRNSLGRIDPRSKVELVCLGNGWRYLECLGLGKQADIRTLVENTVRTRTTHLAKLLSVNPTWISSLNSVAHARQVSGMTPKDVIARTGLHLAMHKKEMLAEASNSGIRSVNGLNEERYDRESGGCESFPWSGRVGNFAGQALAPTYQIDLVPDADQLEFSQELKGHWVKLTPGKFSTLSQLYRDTKGSVDDYFDEMCRVTLVSDVRPFPALNALFARGLATRLDDKWGE